MKNWVCLRFLSSCKLLALLIGCLAGCATSRDIGAPQLDAGVNPAQGVAVWIERVEDLRRFDRNPTDASMPSLMDKRITDEAMRGRAIARKSYVMEIELGDVLLPRGQSVNALAETAATRAFREAGYRVIGIGDPEYSKAIPVTIQIEKLWAWPDIGFWALALESNYDITVKAAIGPLQKSPNFAGVVRNSMQFATTEDWLGIVKKSLDEFSMRLRERLQAK